MVLRILLAEDEPDLNRLIIDKLQTEHYSVDSCMDGQTALDYLAAADSGRRAGIYRFCC